MLKPRIQSGSKTHKKLVKCKSKVQIFPPRLVFMRVSIFAIILAFI